MLPNTYFGSTSGPEDPQTDGTGGAGICHPRDVWGAPVRSQSLALSLCGLGLQLQQGKLPSLIKLLHKAAAWGWHTQISEHELPKSLPLFLLLNTFSAAAGASFPWQQSLLKVAGTQAGGLTAPQRGKMELESTGGRTS